MLKLFRRYLSDIVHTSFFLIYCISLVLSGYQRLPQKILILLLFMLVY